MLKTLVTVGTGLATSALFVLYVKPWLDAKQQRAEVGTGASGADYHDMIEQLLNTDNQPMRSA